ncbi:WEB family protein At1g12150 [Rutidosis leptorrhynchoides]|uniref:WEB family protein At1g12150 n=1 Tax=Rutidosis leptorrhynchoides TaxID=125765 RepID=UPI003A992F02
MVNIIRSNDKQKGGGGSPKGEVGEIDTRAPFQSVKAAVSLFGEVVKKRDRRTPRRSKLSSENVIDKETQLLLAKKEHQRIKQHLENAETTRSKALIELETAKKALEDLTSSLKGINKLKKTVIEATEVVKEKAKQLEHAKSTNQLGSGVMKQELDAARNHYSSMANELDAAKQQLNKARQDFDAAFDAKQAAFQQAAEAQHTANVNSEKVEELRREITAMRETAQQLNFATIEEQEAQNKIWAEKDAREESYRNSREEIQNKMISLKDEYDPELTRNLEMRFAETTVEIGKLQEEMKRAHASQMRVVKVVTAQLNEASRTLQQVVEEEARFRNLVNGLKQEIENVRKERGELERIEAERYLAEIEKLTLESGKAKNEAEDVKNNAERIKQEAENVRKMAEELEKRLQLALEEVEKAKEAEKAACDDMKVISENQSSQNQQDSMAGKIRIPAAEFETLQKKAEESRKLAEEKEAEAVAQLMVINASKEAAVKKMEANLIAIEEIKTATDIALKGAEQAHAAQTVVVDELQKFRVDQETANR